MRWLLLFIGLLMCVTEPLAQVPTATPIARQGILDLTDWSFENSAVLALNGEWEFYWTQLWNSEDFTALNPERTGFFNFPDIWTNYQHDGEVLSAYGYATFRLTVMLPPNPPIMAIKLPDLGTAYELWLGKRFLAGNGTVGTSSETSIPQYNPQVVEFVHQSSTLELILQISNYDYRVGGPWFPIMFGSSRQINSAREKAVAIDLFLFGSMLIMGLYHFGLFFLRRKDRSPLYFGVYCLMIAIRIMVTEERLLQSTFPEVNWELWMKIEYLSFYLSFPVFSVFIWKLYSQEFPRNMIRLCLALGITASLIVLLTPAGFFTSTVIWYQLYVALFGLFELIVIFRAMRSKREGALIFMAGASALFLAMINDILHARNIITSFYMIHYGLFLFIFVQAYILSQRFSNAFTTAEILLVENKGLVADLKTINEHLEEKVDERTRQLSQKTNDIVSMLENLPEGILTITTDYRIHHEYSRFLEQILETDRISGNTIKALLLENSNLGADTAYSLESALIASLDEDLSNFQINQHFLITSMIKYFPENRQKHFELTWSPVCDDKETIVKILLSIRDVTQLKVLEQEAGEQKRHLEMIGQILGVSRQEFEEFILTAQEFLLQNKLLLQSLPENKNGAIEKLFRNMHTVKGHARTLGLLHLTHEVHHAEQEYENLRRFPDSDWNLELMNRQISRIEHLLAEYAHISDHELGRSAKVHIDSSWTLSREEVTESLALLNQLDFTQYEQSARIISRIRFMLLRLGTLPLAEILERITRSLPLLASDLGKKPPRIIIEDQGILFREPSFNLLQNVFMHLFRNSLDHGIEAPETRVQRQKPEQGSILLDARSSGDCLEVVYRDDGQGLSLGKIREKALAQSLIMSDHEMEPEQLAELIFHSGFSTSEQVSEISGRGVGMDAVKQFLHDHGGDIRLRLLQPSELPEQAAFEFVITLPGSMAILPLNHPI
ncbi:MAG: Hpt domain-containing protein [SAR324 cluster bacterium]|nr:Hpt domain-containing protein [SAR324 cluster bacterium]